MTEPPPFSEAEYPSVLEGNRRLHRSSAWIHDMGEKQFFHPPNNTYVTSRDNVPEMNSGSPKLGPKDSKRHRSIESGHVESLAIPTMDSTTSAESEDEVSIDIFNDIRVVSAQAKGAKEGECEDRVIDKFTLPLGYMNSSASCVMLAVLDGHGGSLCVDYVQKQLGVSLIAALRNPQKRKGSDSETLQTVLRKAFQNTDHNFMYLAKRSGNSSGSTIAFATMFGPDASDGSLRVLLGSLGDSRAVLFRLDKDDLEQKRVIAVASSPVHKPSGKSEMRRIQSQGGQVCNIQGIERVIKKVNQTTFGLSVSRAFGDLPLKEPNMVISNVPDFTEQTIDFDLDQFLVLATDGVFDFVSFEQVGKLISNAERTEKGLKKAAEEILTLAKSQGSADDRTCVIVDFSWARRFAPVQQEIERASEKDTSDADDDDIFNIHQT